MTDYNNIRKLFTLSFFKTLIVIVVASPVYAQRDYGIHDPAGFVKENERYYTFYTSNGVEYAYSSDLCTWSRGGTIFSSGFPSWITGYVPGFKGHFWAPQVFYMNKRWHVYYSCSTFGSRESAIGLATTSSLNDPVWTDQGMVVFTNGSSDHNAIDAAVLQHDGKVWLLYGSFWSGIVMTELDSISGKPVDRNKLYYVADGNPEAAFAIHHGEYYYLFFNRGKCCEGVNSTYYINVGRSLTPTGPYLDKSGKSTGSGGGTVLLKTDGKFIGPGHFGYFAENGREYMSYHYYDRDQNGISKLKISTLSWQDGWPVVNTGFDICNSDPVKDCAGIENGTAYIDGCGVCVGGTTDKQPCAQDCNGNWSGSAYRDSCNICVGGQTGLKPCKGLIGGEDAFEFDGIVESTNSGYTGDGYLNFTNKTGAFASFEICTDSASTYVLAFRYANGGSGDRNVSLLVNGVEQIAVFEIKPTESWTDWRTVNASLALHKGKNAIKLNSLRGDGGPNLDCITFYDNNLSQCTTPVYASDKEIIKMDGMIYKDGVVSFYIEDCGKVNLRLYTISGRVVKSLDLEKTRKGINSQAFNRSSIGRGIYLLVLIGRSADVRYEKLISIF